MVPVQPQARAVADGLGGEAGRAAGRGGVPAAQPGGGGDRGRQRGADRGDQRVQPPDQDGLALDLRVAEAGAFLLVPVDPLLRRVDVHEGQHVRAGQQRRLAREPGQQLPPGLLQLQHVSPGIAAQVRAERGRGADPAEQHVHRPVPQQAHVIDASPRPAAMPATRQPTFRRRVHPAPAARPDVLGEQFRQPGAAPRAPPPGTSPPCDTRFGSSNTARVRAGAMRQSHLRGVLSDRRWERRELPSSQFRGHLSRCRARNIP